MAATHSENPALHDHLVLGETLFVTSAILAPLSDVLITFRALVLPSAVGAILGFAFLCGTICFINRLYTGRKEARQTALIWILAQIALTVIAVALLLSQHTYLVPPSSARRFAGVAAWAQRLVPGEFLGLFKIAAYGLLGYVITQRTPALFFLRHRGGEAVEVPTPTTPLEDVTPAGVSIPLTPNERTAVSTLVGTMQGGGAALVTAGLFQAVLGLLQIPTLRRLAWLQVGEGAVLVLLGASLLLAIGSVRNVAERGSDANFVVDSISRLSWLSAKQIALVLALLALTIAGIALRVR